jgi:hypothetical protein
LELGGVAVVLGLVPEKGTRLPLAEGRGCVPPSTARLRCHHKDDACLGKLEIDGSASGHPENFVRVPEMQRRYRCHLVDIRGERR